MTLGLIDTYGRGPLTEIERIIAMGASRARLRLYGRSRPGYSDERDMCWRAWLQQITSAVDRVVVDEVNRVVLGLPQNRRHDFVWTGQLWKEYNALRCKR